ncbi:reverse transcriptase domain-containing protein [Tanacetum coccineum]
MRTRSSSNLVGESSPNLTTSNPKHRNRRRSKQPFSLEESQVDTMADQRTMAELLRAPTEGYAEAIVVPPILAQHFELKHSLINMMTSDQFFGLEKDNPHDHIRWFNKITSTIKYKDVPNSAIKLMLFPFSLAGAARRWLKKEPPRSILTWEDLDLLRACPHHGFTELHQLDTFYNALNPADQDSLNSAAGGNLLERRTQDVLTIIENKSKVRNSRNKSIVSQVKSSDVNSFSSSEIAKFTHAVNQQTSVVTTVMIAILKQFQATPPPASVKAVEEICVTCGGSHPYYQCLVVDGNTFWDNIQGYVSAAAVNYNQGNSGYRPPSVANQIRPPGFAQPNVQNNQNRFSQPQGYNRGNNFNQDISYQAPIQQNQVVPLSELEKIKKINEVNIKAMQAQINNVKNELRNEMQTSIQASISNQTNELKNIMASFFQMNTASTSCLESLPSNTIANPKGELKVITTRSGLVLDGPSFPMPPPFINLEEEERVEETLTDPKLAEYTIKVPPPLVQKAKPPSQRNYVVHQRDPRYPHIPYPSRMNQEKRQEKDEVQIHKFWQMFKQLHINISLADALILIPKYQKMLKSLLSNKEKLIELANTPLNENCSAVILKKLPEKLGDPGKFLIPCGFSELKCKALADLGASINLMPLSVWKKLGLPELISTQMTLELANREICTPVGIARDVFVPVGKFTFPADFVIVDYESDPRVPLILGRPFLRTARALIDVHGEEIILYLFATNHLSGNPTSSSHPDLTSPKVNDDIFDPEEDIIEIFLNLDKTKDLPPYHDKPLSGNPTSISEPVTKSSSIPILTLSKKVI